MRPIIRTFVVIADTLPPRNWFGGGVFNAPRPNRYGQSRFNEIPLSRRRQQRLITRLKQPTFPVHYLVKILMDRNIWDRAGALPHQLTTHSVHRKFNLLLECNKNDDRPK
jgi:hypothetical protein